MRIPTFGSLDLAYETGVHLGDGCLQHYLPYDYRYAISGSRRNEQEYYRGVLSPVLRELYGVIPGITESHGSIFLYVYSKELVLFKRDTMKMPIGRKDQLTRLPNYIRAATDSWVANFLSGFYDTDGCVKLRKTLARVYPRISLAQKVRGVVADVKQLLNRFSISSTMYENTYLDHRTDVRETRWFLDINGYENYQLFMAFVGTRNPYTLGRISSLGLRGL
jgi:hypothetical protein